MPEPLRREVRTADAPAPAFSYSQGIIAGGMLYIAGQVPKDPVTGDIPETFAEQARRTLDNLSAVAHAGGTSLANAVRVNVYLDDVMAVYELEPIYHEYFTPPFPVRTTVRAGLRGILIEVDAIVALPEDQA